MAYQGIQGRVGKLEDQIADWEGDMGMNKEAAVGNEEAVVAGAVEVVAVRQAFGAADSGSVAPVVWIPRLPAALGHWRPALDVSRSIERLN